MLVTLGSRGPAGEDVVDLLLACHERIRRFLGMAGQLARAADVPAEEIRGAAAQVRRYFAEALPLHVADEDLDVTSRLTGRDPELDAALAELAAEHATHEPLIARLVEHCAALERDPEALADVAAGLAEVVGALEAQLAPHLAREERSVFPALRALPAAERTALRDAMRARRERPAPAR